MIAYVSAGGQPSIARHIVAEHVSPGWQEIHIALPMRLVPELAHAAYDEGAARIGAVLERGRDVAVLCVGDPFVYGSFAQLFERLGDRYRTEVVPGVASFTAAAAAARTPLVGRSETLVVLPATLARDALATHLARRRWRGDPEARPASRQGPQGPLRAGTAGARDLCRACQHGATSASCVWPIWLSTKRHTSPCCCCRRVGEHAACVRRSSCSARVA